MDSLLTQSSRIFDVLDAAWERFVHRGRMGIILVLSFLVSIAVIEANRQGMLPAPLERFVARSHFGAVDVAFTLLLVVEIIALVFALAHSVATSIGKQFELFSLILLRKAFLEFGKFGEPIEWAHASERILVALADISGALLIFVTVGIYYRLQRHRPITVSEREQASFVATKKLVALGLLLVFGATGVIDGWRWLSGGATFDLFHAFYTILVFSDILIVLVSLMYSADYHVVFRNSGFAAATVVLRLALVSPAYVNALLGLGAALLVVGLSYAYNAFAAVEDEFPSRAWRAEILSGADADLR